MVKTRTIQVRVSEELGLRVEAAAARERRSVSDWARIVLSDQAEFVLGVEGALVEAGEDASPGEVRGHGGRGEAAASSPASTSAHGERLSRFDPRCRNASVHLEGKACRWCGGSR